MTWKLMKISIFFQKQTQRFQNQMVTTGETIAGREGLGGGNNINTLLYKTGDEQEPTV